jgi:hypothetical protein
LLPAERGNTHAWHRVKLETTPFTTPIAQMPVHNMQTMLHKKTPSPRFVHCYNQTKAS